MQHENHKPAIIACVIVALIALSEFTYCGFREDKQVVYVSNVIPAVNIDTLPACPKCGSIGCIYESIDTMTDGSDKSTFDAIMYYSKERGLNDKQVDILLHEYKLD